MGGALPDKRHFFPHLGTWNTRAGGGSDEVSVDVTLGARRAAREENSGRSRRGWRNIRIRLSAAGRTRPVVAGSGPPVCAAGADQLVVSMLVRPLPAPVTVLSSYTTLGSSSHLDWLVTLIA
ncbi:hypothetical protein LX83_003656 [Goodfellowiella coeruleoviolacea]|uniref:Uncharacterized protein n=1 Tax=Goodfellowiella coeruleoviolacea TaxID=334858 RepID=A0AAE3GGB2_9PSEU|nr:hypothetical protein [Goodfellowiella coeruleoviolacea]